MTGNAIRIRLAEPRDADAVAAIYRPWVTDSATSFETEAPSADEMRQRIEKILARTPWLVAERDGVVIGYAYAGWHRERAAYQWSVEVSAYVGDGARGTGIGRRLYETLFAILELQGFANAFAGMTVPNEASDGFHRALGFVPIGVFRQIGYKFGKWHDTSWLGRRLGGQPRAPEPPIPLPEILESEELRAILTQ